MRAVCGIALLLVCFTMAAAQSVQRTAFEQSPSAATITFGRRPALVGDVLAQQIESTLEMVTTERQEAKVLGERESQVAHRQNRTVKALEISAGRIVAAEVSYQQAVREAGDSSPEHHAVEGKTYLVRRTGEQLEVRAADGKLPPIAEFQRVSADLGWLGQSHPLAELFAGRKLSVGDRLEVPPKVAQQLVAFDRDLGEVEKFVLVLREIEGPLAKFETIVDVASHDNMQLRMAGMGRLVIDSRSCRAVEAEIAGPIGLSETRGGVGLKYQVTGTGKLAMKIRTEYRDAGAERE